MKPDGKIIFELKVLDNCLRRRGEAFNREVGSGEQLTRMHHWIIGYLYGKQNDDIFQKDIEAQFKISRSTTSSMLTLMEKKGLIKRNYVLEDARLKRITLTKKAIDIHERHMQGIAELENMALNAFTPEETKEFLRLIYKLRAATGVDIHDEIPAPPEESEKK